MREFNIIRFVSLPKVRNYQKLEESVLFQWGFGKLRSSRLAAGYEPFGMRAAYVVVDVVSIIPRKRDIGIAKHRLLAISIVISGRHWSRKYPTPNAKQLRYLGHKAYLENLLVNDKFRKNALYFSSCLNTLEGKNSLSADVP